MCHCMGISGPFDCCKIIDVHNRNNSISFRISTVWNKLPRDLRECSSISDFKKRLKTHYFKLAFDV